MVGQGLVLWKPKGAIIRQELEGFITSELSKQGYSQVYTPHIGKLDLFRTSDTFPTTKTSNILRLFDKISQLAGKIALVLNFPASWKRAILMDTYSDP